MRSKVRFQAGVKSWWLWEKRTKVLSLIRFKFCSISFLLPRKGIKLVHMSQPPPVRGFVLLLIKIMIMTFFSIYRVGYKHVKAIDKTEEFVSILKNEMVKFKPTRDKFIKEFSLKDYNELVDGWDIKVVRCTKGEQGWGLFKAVKEWDMAWLNKLLINSDIIITLFLSLSYTLSPIHFYIKIGTSTNIWLLMEW